ncbi:glycosyltransferase [Vibrio sp. 10N.286.45.E10]|uniref:glycosyltransferase n=1 Tax=Vibrio sp. 10N.286.45.E10 TaxID=1884476 RepID=UPI0039A4169E
MLTLHNGSLKLPSGIIGFLCSYALGRFDKILVISQKQYDFMQRMGLSHKCIFVDSYIPLKNELNLSIKNKTRVTRFIENYDKCLLGSGYGKKIYCFDYLVDFSRDNPSVGLIIVLYGEFEKDVINFLKESALQLDNLILLDSLEESEFNSLLQHIDIYVRPNSVDSFGIACADAIMFGKLVVASDVCKRFEGVNTFKTNDYDDFVRVLNSALLSTHSKLTELDPELLIQEKISVYNKAYK